MKSVLRAIESVPSTPRWRLPRAPVSLTAAVAVAALLASACTSTATPSPSVTASAPVTPTPAPATSIPTFPSVPPPSSAVIPPPTQAQPTATPQNPCGPNGVFCGPYGWKATYDLPFTNPIPCGQGGSVCLLRMDVFVPVPGAGRGAAGASPPAAGWPLVVAIPGGPVAPGAYKNLAEFGTVMAIHGAVVMAADWRQGPQFGGGYPAAFGDVGCAIQYARSIASRFGADPSRVTLAAHSFGGFAGSVVSLSPTAFEPAAGECLVNSGSAQPGAYVGIAPISSLQEIGSGWLDSFFGGTQSAQPAAWKAADPVALASAPDARRIPVTLVVSTTDMVVPPAKVTPLATALQGNGRTVQVVTVTGADHTSILIWPQTIDAVLAAAGGG